MSIKDLQCKEKLAPQGGFAFVDGELSDADLRAVAGGAGNGTNGKPADESGSFGFLVTFARLLGLIE
ncbi:MAG: hypothetical protein KME30_25395 [Iphinoe sp. HA4291-MV1]|jgi:hypothetical protein|nr:hypothetical protein [Iphinoe sp. HA4291-MV1]